MVFQFPRRRLFLALPRAVSSRRPRAQPPRRPANRAPAHRAIRRVDRVSSADLVRTCCAPGRFVPISGERPARGAFRRPTVRPRAQPCAPCRPRSRRFGLFAPDCRRPCAVPRPRSPSGSSDVRRVSRSCAACGASRSRTYRATRRVRSPGNRAPSGLSSANVRADRVRTSAPISSGCAAPLGDSSGLSRPNLRR